MPYRVAHRDHKWRVVERDTGQIATNRAGTPVDGGGHESRRKATKQSQALNINYARKKGVNIPNTR